MSVLDCLTREHRLFERLILRLRSGVEMPPEAAAPLIRESLQVLLPALERHDALEDTVFGKPGPSIGADEKRARELVEAQHVALRKLLDDIDALLQDPAVSADRLKGMAELLAGRLEWHFKTEEMLLWPIQAKSSGRSGTSSVGRRAEKSVEDLEDAVARLRDFISRSRRGGL